MGRIILGVIAGFVLWSILWLGTDFAMGAAMSWYAQHQADFQRAMLTNGTFEPNTTILLLNIVRALLISIAAGFVAALIARESRRAALILGILLLLFGIMVQVIAWRYLPVWYHLVFLALLIPATVLGGKLHKAEPAVGTD